jgi:hypothetical protein
MSCYQLGFVIQLTKPQIPLIAVVNVRLESVIKIIQLMQSLQVLIHPECDLIKWLSLHLHLELL